MQQSERISAAKQICRKPKFLLRCTDWTKKMSQFVCISTTFHMPIGLQSAASGAANQTTVCTLPAPLKNKKYHYV